MIYQILGEVILLHKSSDWKQSYVLFQLLKGNNDYFILLSIFYIVNITSHIIRAIVVWGLLKGEPCLLPSVVWWCW